MLTLHLMIIYIYFLKIYKKVFGCQGRLIDIY